MNVLYIGGGFVGACSAAVSADSGHQVLVFDVDKRKVELLSSGDRDTIESCLFEDGLADLLIRNKERITFTTDYGAAERFLDTCDAVFMCLPTPEIGETGESDLSFYFAAAEKLAQALVKRNSGRQEKYAVIVNKSTVPVDMADRTAELMDKLGVKNYGVVSNPEFLVEGKAIQGSIHPNRVVVGATRQKDFEVMRQVYQRFFAAAGIEYIETNPTEAEAGKLLANFYLFNKLAICFDVIGRTCETFPGINYENVRKILVSEPRIGAWGLYDSLYAGGSCFIKDARSLAFQLQTAGQNATLVSETYLANKRQLELFLGRAERDAGFTWSSKQVAALGLAFKQNTNDIRNSPSINIVNFLMDQRVTAVRAYDPVATDYFKSIFPASEHMQYANNEREAIAGADVVLIATDWPQFRGLGELIIEHAKPGALIMDGRRMLQHRYDDLQKAGFSIIAVGSPFISGNKLERMVTNRNESRI